MRLAIIGDEVDQNMDRVIQAVSETKFEGVEIRSVWNVPPHELTRQHLVDIRESMKRAGLMVAGFCPPAFKCALPGTDAEMMAARLVLTHAIEQAQILGAPYVRIFTFYRAGDPNPVLAGQIARQLLDGLLTGDMAILVETGMRTNTPTMRHMMQFLEAVGDDRLGVLWDPGNSVFSGQELQPFPGDYEMGRALIRHIHVKDPDGQRAYVRVGDGDLPWQRILHRLADDDFAGWVSLETHWRHGRTLTQIQRDEPWGDEFSHGGYAASVECMKRMRDYVQGLR